MFLEGVLSWINSMLRTDILAGSDQRGPSPSWPVSACAILIVRPFEVHQWPFYCLCPCIWAAGRLGSNRSDGDWPLFRFVTSDRPSCFQLSLYISWSIQSHAHSRTSLLTPSKIPLHPLLRRSPCFLFNWKKQGAMTTNSHHHKQQCINTSDNIFYFPSCHHELSILSSGKTSSLLH